jgi:hypothetical protein
MNRWGSVFPSSRPAYPTLILTRHLGGLLHNLRDDPPVICRLPALETGRGWPAFRPIEGDQQILNLQGELVDAELEAHGYD